MKNETKDLVKLVSSTIGLAQEKFKDPDTNKPPEFILNFSFNKNKIIHADYIPKLNNFGGEHYLWMTYGNTLSLALPWTYEDTIRFLKDLPEDAQINFLILDNQGNWNAYVSGICAGQIIFSEEMPQIFASIISGGTRKGKNILSSKMRRPWQPDLPLHNLENCPLCNKFQTNEQTMSSELKSFDNSSTPYRFHKLIIPTKEFYLSNKSDNHFLFESEGLIKILNQSQELISKNDLPTSHLYVHKGYLAGQNLGHLHFHLISND